MIYENRYLGFPRNRAQVRLGRANSDSGFRESRFSRKFTRPPGLGSSSRCKKPCFSRPPYSPDLNWVEEAFSKVKIVVRTAAAHARKALDEAIGEAPGAVALEGMAE